MPSIAPGVDYDTIAREWRCKWSEDDDKKSLVEVQKIFAEITAKLSGVKGVKNVQRMVCGQCFDFKVDITLSVDNFAAWEKDAFAPEGEFLEAIKAIPGVTAVETQTITSMSVKVIPPRRLKKPKITKIISLNPESSGFTLEGKVLEDPTEVEGSRGAKFKEIKVGDASGQVVLSLREDQATGITKDQVLTVRNAGVRMIKNFIRVVVDKWGKIDLTSEASIDEVGSKNVSATEFERVG